MDGRAAAHHSSITRHRAAILQPAPQPAVPGLARDNDNASVNHCYVLLSFLGRKVFFSISYTIGRSESSPKKPDHITTISFLDTDYLTNTVRA